MLENRRFELLHRIIADEKSTDAERDAALRELDASEIVSQDCQDKELESCLLFWGDRTVPHRSLESREIRNSVSPASDELLNDLGYPPCLGIVPDGSEERLQALAARTKSEIVRQWISRSLKSIRYWKGMKDLGRVQHG
jgi:hypothetical protein